MNNIVASTLCRAVSKSTGRASFRTSTVALDSRQPLIKFLGKRSLLPKSTQTAKTVTPIVSAAPSKPSPIVQTEVKHTPGAIDFFELAGGALYGRPPVSEEEIEALLTGGANFDLCSSKMSAVVGPLSKKKVASPAKGKAKA